MMDKVVNKTEMIVEEPVQEASSRVKLQERLEELLPQEKISEDVDKMALDFINELVEMNERIILKMMENPRLAQVLADVVTGKRKADTALVRYFGKNVLLAEEGTPEYDELMAADEEFNNEREHYKAMQEEYDAKAITFFNAFRGYCDRMGLDAQEYELKIEDELVAPLLEWDTTDEFFETLINAVNYTKDTEDAFAAGETKGRNTNIHEMRAKMGDGMPKGLTSQGSMAEKPKQRVNSLIAKALEA